MRATFNQTFVVCLILAAGAFRVEAQNATRGAAFATRPQLEALASECARQASDATRSSDERVQALDQAKELQERLRDGDFRVGDRIVLHVAGSGASAADTFSVTPDRAVTIPEAGDIPLGGVLRSELQQHLNTHLARYVRNAVVRAEPLTRLAVLGEIRTPGFVHVPSQSLLSDVVSAGGGPTATGSLDRVIVRRTGRTLISRAIVAKALAKGATLDELDVRAGDEIVLEAKRSFNWSQAIQTSAIVFGSVATMIAIRHR